MFRIKKRLPSRFRRGEYQAGRMVARLQSPTPPTEDQMSEAIPHEQNTQDETETREKDGYVEYQHTAKIAGDVEPIGCVYVILVRDKRTGETRPVVSGAPNMNPFYLQNVLLGGLAHMHEYIMRHKLKVQEEGRIVTAPAGMILPPFPGKGTG